MGYLTTTPFAPIILGLLILHFSGNPYISIILTGLLTYSFTKRRIFSVYGIGSFYPPYPQAQYQQYPQAQYPQQQQQQNQQPQRQQQQQRPQRQ